MQSIVEQVNVYGQHRSSKDYSPKCVYLPHPKLLFKLMKACTDEYFAAAILRWYNFYKNPGAYKRM